jgi:hypothetical protein
MNTIRLFKADIQAMTQPGQDAEADVRHCLSIPRIAKQVDTIPAETMIRELRETGAWGAEELADHDMNRVRFLWLIAGSMRDDNTRTWCV